MKEPIIYPDWLNLQLWQEYKRHRARIKKPMTEYAEQLNINKLNKIMKQGYSQEKIMNNIIEKGWQGIYAPKDNNNFSKPKAEAAPALPYIDKVVAADPEAKRRDLSKLPQLRGMV